MILKNILFSFLIFIFFSGNVFSHQKSQSYTSWEGENIDGNFEVTVKTKISKSILFSQLQNNGYKVDTLETYFKNKIYSEACSSINHEILRTNTAFFKIKEIFSCSTDKPIFNYNLFFDLNITHLDFSSQKSNDEKLPDFIISSETKKLNLFVEQSEASMNLSFYNFLYFGFLHILSGLDHIAFLLLIIFLCKSYKTLLLAISGFTIGHSISLFSSVQGLIISSASLVEIMIGFSILVCSIEVLGKKTNQLVLFSNYIISLWTLLTFIIFIFFPSQALFFLSLGFMVFSYLRLSNNYQNNLNLIFITLVFGFIHGLGFAGAINEIFLPSEDMLKILIAFNLGIEIGQILIFLVVALLVSLLNLFKLEIVKNYSVLAVSLIIFGYSLNLIIERSFLVL
tara:strand:- start:1102 stop:2292 length:1191 start_codon:yes stop_codon:yes gene_type:complete